MPKLVLHVRLLLVLVLVAAFGAPARAAEGATSATFEANGAKIHYLVKGEGEPVVLIHGLYSSALINWGATGVMAALAKDHRVIALDLPGFGESDKPEAESAYGVQMMEDVVLLMDHLKLAKAQVVGYSMGGMVAAKLMVMHPDRVSACVLGGMGWLREGSMLQAFANGGKREGSGDKGIGKYGMGKLAITEAELRAIKMPVIVIVGERDPVKRMYVEPLRPVRRDWPIVEIPEAGHMDCIFKPQFRSEIVRWVDDHSSK